MKKRRPRDLNWRTPQTPTERLSPVVQTCDMCARPIPKLITHIVFEENGATRRFHTRCYRERNRASASQQGRSRNPGQPLPKPKRTNPRGGDAMFRRLPGSYGSKQ